MTMRAAVALLHDHVPLRWTSRDHAELARLGALLARGGIACDVLDGASDEGHPWCAFGPAGSADVFAHFARIDGRYVVDWPGSPGAVLVEDLCAAVDRFLAAAFPGGHGRARFLRPTEAED